jgi:hypothetical protein
VLSLESGRPGVGGSLVSLTAKLFKRYQAIRTDASIQPRSSKLAALDSHLPFGNINFEQLRGFRLNSALRDGHGGDIDPASPWRRFIASFELISLLSATYSVH